MKKITVLLSACLMVFGSLFIAGCSPSDGGGEQGGAEEREMNLENIQIEAPAQPQGKAPAETPQQ